MLNEIAKQLLKTLNKCILLREFLCFRVTKYQLFSLFLKAYSLKNNPRKCFLEETKIIEDVQDKMIFCVRPHDRF